MIVPAIGRWMMKSGKWFIRERIYLWGFVWTPFAKIRKRFPDKPIEDEAVTR
jgi:uncharacterized membrane protein